MPDKFWRFNQMTLWVSSRTDWAVKGHEVRGMSSSCWAWVPASHVCTRVSVQRSSRSVQDPQMELSNRGGWHLDSSLRLKSSTFLLRALWGVFLRRPSVLPLWPHCKMHIRNNYTIINAIILGFVAECRHSLCLAWTFCGRWHINVTGHMDS